jgi:adenylosuccinate synthase
MINGIDELAITNLDGLDQLDPIKICVAYRLDGTVLDVPPSDAAQWTRCEPVYLEMAGWKRSTEKVKKFADLPNEARKYARRIAELTGARLTMVSVGPARGQTLFL